LHRLFVQIERIFKINGLSVITDDLFGAARCTPVAGTASGIVLAGSETAAASDMETPGNIAS